MAARGGGRGLTHRGGLDSVLQEWGTTGRFQRSGWGKGQVEAPPELSGRELREARTRVAAEETSGVDRFEVPGRWSPQGRQGEAPPWMRPRRRGAVG